MTKTRILTVTKKDLVESNFRVGGHGGQHRDKTSAGVRLAHPPSGAVGQSTESRSQHENRILAFRKLVASPRFRLWIAEVDALWRRGKTIEQEVEAMMDPRNIRVEVKRNGKWTAEDLGNDDNAD